MIFYRRHFISPSGDSISAKQSTCIEDTDYEKPCGLVKAKLLELSPSQWLQQHFFTD
jgi:hypothetical protein